MRFLWLALLCLLPSCGTVEFYTQAVTGHTILMAKRKPVDKLIADPATSPAFRERLKLSQRMLAFAHDELGMSSHGSYELYADLKREHTVYVVHAAPELSLEPKRWWYPVVGEQDYRGYFSERLAEREKARLRRDGYETWAEGVDAYSTLGVFRDPLLNTFIGRDETSFAELIFHELAHHHYYRPGDTRFNEGMAEAVARESVRRWFKKTGRPELAARYEVRLKRLAQARNAIGHTVEHLHKVYASDLPDEAKRREKAAEIARLKIRLQVLRGEWGGGLAAWIHGPINNARLNAFTAYEDEVPKFVKLLKDCHGDFPCFWERVKKL